MDIAVIEMPVQQGKVMMSSVREQRSEKQHKIGKKTAWERIDSILDPESFEELDHGAKSPFLEEKFETFVVENKLILDQHGFDSCSICVLNNSAMSLILHIVTDTEEHAISLRAMIEKEFQIAMGQGWCRIVSRAMLSE